MLHSMDRNSIDHLLKLLLSKLRVRQSISPISSIADIETIKDLHDLLSKEEDHDKVAKQLVDALDIETMLEFMLYAIRNHVFQELGMDADSANRRARRLMFKITSSTPIMPSSLFLSDLTISCNHDVEHLFKGEHNGKLVVLKPLYRTRNNVTRDFCREALTWRSLPNDFVLPFLGIYENEAASQFFLVVPYMTNDTLARWRKKRVPSVVEVKQRLLQVAEGLHYIHSQGIVHGDLCGANIFLDQNFRVKIAGFGLTRHSEHVVTGYGALHENFAAPELFVNSDGSESEFVTTMTQESDIYAYGCLYYEIYYDAIPFWGEEYAQIMRAVTHGERPPYQSNPPMSGMSGI
ncbi:kinase-like domain-containing protein [Amanita rubescens]|nr:kinase-like domain-containing protein [Amanita rubescens]